MEVFWRDDSLNTCSGSGFSPVKRHIHKDEDEDEDVKWGGGVWVRVT